MTVADNLKSTISEGVYVDPERMVYCKECGAENEDDSLKCKECGAFLRRPTNLEWGRLYETVEGFNSFREASRRVNNSLLRRWHKWMSENVVEVRGMTPDEMVEYQRKANGVGVVDHSVFFQVYQALKAVNPGLELDGVQLLEAQEEIKQNVALNRYAIVDGTARYILKHRENWRMSYQLKILSIVKSYFEAEHANLPISSKIKRCVAQTVPPLDQSLTLEDIKQVVNGSNEMYRAIFLCILAGGMGSNEIRVWSAQGIETLEEALENSVMIDGEELVKIKFTERKGSARPYWTLIGGDALQALKVYLKCRERKREVYEERTGKTYPSTVFVTNINTPLHDMRENQAGMIRDYWYMRLLRMGIIERGERGKHMHQIRDRFRSQWGKVHGKESVGGDAGEFLMGHVIDPNRYNEFYKDPQGENIVFRAYVKVLPMLNIMSSGKPFGLYTEEEVDKERESARKRAQEKSIEENRINNLQLQKKYDVLSERIDNLTKGKGNS